MTIRDVARHLDVAWDVTKDMQKRDLARRFPKPKLTHPRHLPIDEIAVAKEPRWLSLKKAEILDEGQDEKSRLEEALALNKPQA
jgi:hypothetical protein